MIIESTLIALLLGFAVGAVGSIPVAGPISATVVGCAIDGDYRRGLAVAWGGALAKGLYAGLALWGVSHYLDGLDFVKPLSLVLSCVMLAALGFAFLRMRPGARRAASPNTKKGGFGYGLLVALCNPTLIITFTAIATFFHTQGVADLRPIDAIPFGLGTCLGMATWFAVLLVILRRVQHRVSHQGLARAARWVGHFMLVLAAWFAVRAGLAITVLTA